MSDNSESAISEPPRTQQTESEILTIMLVDMAGYTKRTASFNRKALEQLHEVFDSIALPLFERYHGEVIKKMGDAFLVTFHSPTDSLLCGIDLQKAFGYYNKGQQMAKQIHIRVVLHTGEVLRMNGDIYGDAVNTTARVEGIAKEGHIVFTGSMYLAMNRSEIPHTHIGTFNFKGIRNPIRLFRVLEPYDKIGMQLAQRGPERRRPRKGIDTAFILMILAFLIIAVAILAFYLLNPDIIARWLSR